MSEEKRYKEAITLFGKRIASEKGINHVNICIVFNDGSLVQYCTEDDDQFQRLREDKLDD